MADYLTHVAHQRPLVNIAQLVGHTTVRYANSRRDRGDMSPQDLERCLESTRQALSEGACGLSFGLGYDPGMYASLEELGAFSRVAAEAGKPVTIHMKALSRLSPCYPLTMLAAHNIKALQEALLLAEKSRGATLMLYHTYSGEPGFEDPLEKVLCRDYCLFETDAAIKANGLPNPAATGTFPRILGRFVRDQKLFSVEEAVRRMTHASAERFGLKDVGCLTPGMAADLVLFDPREIADNPGGGRQAAGRPEGIKRVLLNGQTVVNDGIYVEGVRPGRVLKV